MNEREARLLVQKTFGAPFDGAAFSAFSRNLLRNMDESNLWKRGGNLIPDAYAAHIASYSLTGRYRAGGDDLAVLVVRLKKGETLERARTTQRNFVAWYLSDKGKDAALVAFVPPEGDEWRFSFIRLEYSLAKTVSGAVRIEQKLTPARRSSFLVGAAEPHRTAETQLLNCLLANFPLALDDIERAFSVEAVTESFFREYATLFAETVSEVEKALRENETAAKIFDERFIHPRHFAQKLLSQIVFLYFVQKKGWLGVPRGGKWGEGDPDFLASMFARSRTDFYREVLEPLFYDALATDRDDGWYAPFGCRVPFLNGGLFEPLNGHPWREAALRLPDALFGRIFGVFNAYNFTIREDEPLEKDIAVDPEMLGKVFESLLDIDSRKEKGAFYTPSDIVHYICVGTVARFLAKECSIPEEDVAHFFRFGETLAEQEVQRASKERDTETYRWNLPESVRTNARALDEALARLTVCDPAVGSGAFLVGMLQVVAGARKALGAYLQEGARSSWDLKRECIRSSLYGVDLEPAAVDIAKLRLWLSLLVDEEGNERIEPLPNLDYNILQGNSLVESPGDVDLSDFGDALLGDPEEEALFRRLNERRAAFFDATLGGEKERRRRELEDAILAIPKERLLRKRRFYESEREKDLRAAGGVPAIVAEIESRSAALFESITKQEEELARALGAENRRTFFPWRLYFADVFHRDGHNGEGGFRIVVENPPYVRQEGLKEMKKRLKEYAVFKGTADLFVYFVEKSWSILAPGGQIGMIVSNKWMRADYGAPLRGFLAGRKIHELIDFGDLPVFSKKVIAYPCILMGENSPSDGRLDAATLKTLDYASLAEHLASERFEVRTDDLFAEAWVLAPSPVLRLLRKVRGRGVPLGEYVEGKIFYGIKTGLNEAFVIDEATKERLLAEDPGSAELIKPFLAGDEIKRYAEPHATHSLVCIRNGFTRERSMGAKEPWTWLQERYPAVAAHLAPFEAKARKRADQGEYWWELRSCAYYDEFEKGKILFPDIAEKGSFTMDAAGRFYCANTGYFIPSDKPYLCGILNSRLLNFLYRFFLAVYRGNYYRFFTQYLETLPIPVDTSEPNIVSAEKAAEGAILQLRLHESLRACVDPAEKAALRQRIAKADEEIDAAVYALYGLSADEIALVERTVPCSPPERRSAPADFVHSPRGDEPAQSAEVDE